MTVLKPQVLVRDALMWSLAFGAGVFMPNEILPLLHSYSTLDVLPLFKNGR